MKVQAALLRAPRTPFTIEELELEPPRVGEVLVQIKAVGVCHSDWHLVTGSTKHPLPVVAGHEGAGIVEAVGPQVDDLAPGDPVILSWAPSCSECFYCRNDQPNLCDTYTGPIWAGTMLDGTTRLSLKNHPVYSYCGLAAFAQRTVVLRQSCIKIRADVPFESAALVGCAVATGVGAAMLTAQIQAGQNVAVIGCGGVGLNCIQGAAFRGAAIIIAVDTNAHRLQWAREFGATHTIPPNSEDVPKLIRSLTHGRGADHVLEAVGKPALQELAMECARPGGVVTLAGLAPMGSTTNFSSAVIVRQEKTIRGSYYGSVNPQRDFPKILELYKQGKLKLDEMVSKRYALSEINVAFKEMLEGNVARGVIVFD